MPGQSNNDNKPPFNLTLAQAIYGQETKMMTRAQTMPGFPDRDPTPEEEAVVEAAWNESISPAEVLRRTECYRKFIKASGDMPGLIGSTAFDMAMGSYNNDVPTAIIQELEKLEAIHRRFQQEVLRSVYNIQDFYRARGEVG